MFWNDVLEGKYPVVIGTNHPMSLGYRLKLVSTSPYASKECRVSQRVMNEILEVPNKFEGMHGVWDRRRLVVIAINFNSTTAWAKRRIIELVVHECSHAVDDMFKRASVKNVDTEVRAYTIDWMVGEVFSKFPKIAK